jgi:hypothetical protein
MASWKKIIVSGSDAVLNQLNVGTSQVITSTNELTTTKITGSFTGSFFGDGTGITGITATGLNIPGTVTVITNEPFVVSGSAALQKITLSDVLTQITGSTDGGLTKSGSNALRIDTGSNHFTNGVRSKVSAVSYLGYNSTTGVFTFDSGSYGTFAAGAGLGSTNGVLAVNAGQGISVTAPTSDAVNIDTGSIHFVTGSRKAVFETGRFVDSSEIDFTVTAGVSVTAALINGSIANARLANSAVTITAGAGLINGGSVALGSSTTLNVGAGTGITVNADDIALKNAGSLTANLLTKWDSANGQLVNSSITDVGGIVTVAAGLEVGAPTGIASAGQIVTQAGIFVESGGVNVTGNSTFVNNVIVNGDLTVNGTTTTLNTTNLLVSDKFALFASGSDASTDGGIIVQQGATTGYALGVDASADRWALQNNLGHTATTITPDSYVVSAVGAASGPSAAPVYGGASFGYGNIHVNTSTGDIFIYS